MCISNQSRANWGLVAMAAGAPDYVTNDQQTSLSDVLANLMHEADRAGLDFNRALDDAHRHHHDEVLEETAPIGAAVP
jgi:hypothetical protein